MDAKPTTPLVGFQFQQTEFGRFFGCGWCASGVGHQATRIVVPLSDKQVYAETVDYGALNKKCVVFVLQDGDELFGSRRTSIKFSSLPRKQVFDEIRISIFLRGQGVSTK